MSRKHLLLWHWRALGHKHAVAGPRLVAVDGCYAHLYTLSPEGIVELRQEGNDGEGIEEKVDEC